MANGKISLLLIGMFLLAALVVVIVSCQRSAADRQLACMMPTQRSAKELDSLLGGGIESQTEP